MFCEEPIVKVYQMMRENQADNEDSFLKITHCPEYHATDGYWPVF